LDDWLVVHSVPSRQIDRSRAGTVPQILPAVCDGLSVSDQDALTRAWSTPLSKGEERKIAADAKQQRENATVAAIETDNGRLGNTNDPRWAVLQQRLQAAQIDAKFTALCCKPAKPYSLSTTLGCIWDFVRGKQGTARQS
jgi:hypothetical protein